MVQYAVRPFHSRPPKSRVAKLPHPTRGGAAIHGTVRRYNHPANPRRPQPGVLPARERGGLLPVDQDYALTADTVVDDPREPQIVPTGVLDERGQMLCRVIMPLKVKMGFHSTMEPAEEDVMMLVPEDMLRISDCGAGMDYFDEADFDGGDE